MLKRPLLTFASNSDNTSLADQLYIKTLVKKNEAHLRHHQLTPLMQGNHIKIHEIIVTELDDASKGEFHYVSRQNGTHVFDREKESAKMLIDRIYKQILTLADLATDHHLRENFTVNQNEYDESNYQYKDLHLKTACLNHVIRVSTNEFFFFPDKKRGPLTMQNFQSLITVLQTLAEQLPENLHFALGSFPIMMPDQSMNNIVIYIQCGKNPKLTSITKSIPADNDPLYDNTNNVAHVNYIVGNAFIKKIKGICKQLADAIVLDDETKSHQLIEQLKQIDETYPEYALPSSFKEAIEQLQTLLGENPFAFSELNGSHLHVNLLQCMEVYLSEVQERVTRYAQYANDHRYAYASVFNLGMSPGVHFSYGGYIECQTSGGIPFITIIDICNDHHSNLAKKRLLNEIHLTLTGRSDVIPGYVSQMLISNIKFTEESAAINQDLILTHVDPMLAGIVEASDDMAFHKGTLVIPAHECNAYIGEKIRIKIYEPRTLTPLADDIAIALNTANHFAIQLKSLQLTRSQRPQHHIMITKMIDHLILDDLYQQLKLIEASFNLSDYLPHIKTFISTHKDKIQLTKVDNLNRTILLAGLQHLMSELHKDHKDLHLEPVKNLNELLGIASERIRADLIPHKKIIASLKPKEKKVVTKKLPTPPTKPKNLKA